MTTSAVTARDEFDAEVAEGAGKYWWVLLVTGGLWLTFGWIVLSARSEITTVWAVCIYAGILFLMFAAGELVGAFVVEGWRWLHLLIGAGALIAGVMCFVWPEQTFITLAAILAWYLLFDGVLHIVRSLASRHDVDIWWMYLILGVLEIAIAFWAIGYTGRSVALLVVWVGAMALAKGLAQIVGAFMLRAAR
jgi:uncharacterized membrane protein HdeD (DUF308 family)